MEGDDELLSSPTCATARGVAPFPPAPRHDHDHLLTSRPASRDDRQPPLADNALA